MLTDGNYTYSGEHFIMYINVESLHCMPGNIIICHHFLKIAFSNPWYLLFSKRIYSVPCPSKNASLSNNRIWNLKLTYLLWAIIIT